MGYNASFVRTALNTKVRNIIGPTCDLIFFISLFFLSARTLNSCNGYQMFHASTTSANTICKCIVLFPYLVCPKASYGPQNSSRESENYEGINLTMNSFYFIGKFCWLEGFR